MVYCKDHLPWWAGHVNCIFISRNLIFSYLSVTFHISVHSTTYSSPLNTAPNIFFPNLSQPTNSKVVKGSLLPVESRIDLRVPWMLEALLYTKAYPPQSPLSTLPSTQACFITVLVLIGKLILTHNQL